MSLVVDPRGAQEDVKTPVVHWDGQPEVGTETWTAKVTKRSTASPQIELRRLLDNGGTAVIRLNIGNIATNAKGAEVRAGIVMSSNKSVNLLWPEYFALQMAIDEGITYLIAEHERIYQEIADKLAKKNKPKEAPQAATGPIGPIGTVGVQGEAGVAGPSGVGEGDPDFDDEITREAVDEEGPGEDDSPV